MPSLYEHMHLFHTAKKFIGTDQKNTYKNTIKWTKIVQPGTSDKRP